LKERIFAINTNFTERNTAIELKLSGEDTVTMEGVGIEPAVSLGPKDIEFLEDNFEMALNAIALARDHSRHDRLMRDNK